MWLGNSRYRVRWNGNVRGHVRWYGPEIERLVDGALEVKTTGSAKRVLAEAKRNCPVGDKGALKESGRIVVFTKDGVVGAYVKFGGQGYMSKGKDTYYGPFVELGTPGTVIRSGKGIGGKREPVKATPFLRDALKKEKRNYYQSLDGALK